MYQNGRRLNRYARKRKHIDNLKRRMTPYDFQNYESFVEYETWWNAMRDEWFQARYPQYYKRKADTRCPWYLRYWEAYSGCVAPGWKKHLKHDAHRSERNQWRNRLQNLPTDVEEIEDENIPNERRGAHYSDPWRWD